ncbi:hypothetical protein P2318_18065 [Myxococcaceae bacterium GXIMD 01537]
MKHIKSMGLGMALAAALLGCGGDSPGDDDDDTPPKVERCGEPTSYFAFNAANHAAQERWQQRLDDLLILFDTAKAEPARAVEMAQRAQERYTAADVGLRDEVLQRVDVHVEPALAVGEELDATFSGAIAELRAAATATQVARARKRLETAGIHRFLFLSAAEALFPQPSYKHYDEAFGAIGTGPENAPAGRRGLARLATERDAALGTTHSADLFAVILEGACILERSLKALGATEMGAEEDGQYVRLARQVDARLRLIFAYSLGQALSEFPALRATPSAAHEKLVEVDGFFRSLEPLMKAAGGAQEETARALREALDAVRAKAEAGTDPDWPAQFDTEGLLLHVEESLGIDVGR